MTEREILEFTQNAYKAKADELEKMVGYVNSMISHIQSSDFTRDSFDFESWSIRVEFYVLSFEDFINGLKFFKTQTQRKYENYKGTWKKWHVKSLGFLLHNIDDLQLNAELHYETVRILQNALYEKVEADKQAKMIDDAQQLIDFRRNLQNYRNNAGSPVAEEKMA